MEIEKIKIIEKCFWWKISHFEYRKTLTKKEIDFLADFFHYNSDGGPPDLDGYLGHYTVPKEIMDRMKEKYPNMWGVKK